MQQQMLESTIHDLINAVVVCRFLYRVSHFLHSFSPFVWFLLEWWIRSPHQRTGLVFLDRTFIRGRRFKTLVGCLIYGIILPNYVGIIISQYKDPYKPIRIQWKVIFGFGSRCSPVNVLFFGGEKPSNRRPKLLCQNARCSTSAFVRWLQWVLLFRVGFLGEFWG